MGKSFTTTLRSLFRAWPYTLIVVCSMLAIPAQPAAAEGSRTLFPTPQGARANLEWYGSGNRYGTQEFNLTRRTLLKVYAEQGEYIFAGSSAIAVPNATSINNKGDVLIYDDKLLTGVVGSEVLPSTALFSCLQQRTQTGNKAQGRIGSRAQELAGPDTITNAATATAGKAVANGYVPCFYQAPATGIYDVVMYGPNGTVDVPSNSPTGQLGDVAANFDGSQQTTVAAWDVTVRGSLTDKTDINGRLFTYYLSLFTGGNGRPIFSTIYMVTLDGFQYKLNLKGMDPNGFITYGNMRGFVDTDGNLLYHDVLAKLTHTNGISMTFQEQNELRELQGDVKLAAPEYPLFFNTPDLKAVAALGLPTAPVLPKITSFTFKGKNGGTVINVDEGGTFAITSNAATVFDVVLSHDRKDFSPTTLSNKVFRNVVTQSNATTTIPWDGNDNSGNPFPEGGPYIARVSLHGGELHFPFLDVENNTQGSPIIEMINPPTPNCAPIPTGCTGAFYDDRGYVTANGTVVGTGQDLPLCMGNPGNAPALSFSDPVNGFNTTTIVTGTTGTQRAFGFPTGGNPPAICDPKGGFGDKKGLDLWTYFPGDKADVRLTIVSGVNAIDLTRFSAYAQQNTVTVQWETSAEVNTLGFNLYRSSDGTRANAVLVTPQLLLAQGRGQAGASYTWTDPNAPAGHRYSYWLEEVETTGGTHEYGPAAAALGATSTGSYIYLPLLN